MVPSAEQASYIRNCRCHRLSRYSSSSNEDSRSIQVACIPRENVVSNNHRYGGASIIGVKEYDALGATVFEELVLHDFDLVRMLDYRDKRADLKLSL